MAKIPEWYDEVLTAAISVNQLLHRSFENKEFKNNILRNLCGACHIGSVFLLRRIKHLKPALIIGECRFCPEDKKDLSFTGHCWLEIDDYIIDCTFSQFERYENIKICHKSSVAARRYKATLRNRKARKEHWNIEGNQNPSKWRYCRNTNSIVPSKLFFTDREDSFFSDYERRLYK